MSIKRRIWSLPTTAIVIFSIGLAVCVYFSSIAVSSITQNSKLNYPVLDKTKILAIDIQALSKDLEDAVGNTDKKEFRLVQDNAKKIIANIQTLGKLEGEGPVAARLENEFSDYYVPASTVAKIMLDIEQGDAGPMVAKMRSALTVLKADLAQYQKEAEDRFNAGVEKSNVNVNNVLYTSIIVAVIVISVLLVSSFIVVRGIWNQLGGEPEYTRDIAVSIAAGDLSMQIETDSRDTTSLLIALKDMKSRLELMISSIKMSAQTIHDASTEIANGNGDLSSRTAAQVQSLQHTTNLMSQIEITVNQNAENAGMATRLAGVASDVAVKGGQVVQQVIGTMSEINVSSKKIVDIISVIDGISFQTNILALNAAVEAARAGEQGRGFAVVASEVRNLAQRSATAAKEISALISDSVDKVTAGTELVDKAGQTMNEIVESVKSVSDIMKEISEASQDQSNGILEIGKAIADMDAMTQQNSSLVVQATNAADSMQSEAANLIENLDVFKLSKPVR